MRAKWSPNDSALASLFSEASGKCVVVVVVVVVVVKSVVVVVAVVLSFPLYRSWAKMPSVALPSMVMVHKIKHWNIGVTKLVPYPSYYVSTVLLSSS